MIHNKKQVMQDNIDVFKNTIVSIHSNEVSIHSSDKELIYETSLQVLVPPLIRNGFEAFVGVTIKPYIDYTIDNHKKGLLIDASFLSMPFLLTGENNVSIKIAIKE